MLQPFMNQAILSREGKMEVLSSNLLAMSSLTFYATEPFSAGREIKRKVINLTSLPTSSPALYATKTFSAGRERECYKSYLLANKFSSLVRNQTILSKHVVIIFDSIFSFHLLTNLGQVWSSNQPHCYFLLQVLHKLMHFRCDLLEQTTILC